MNGCLFARLCLSARKVEAELLSSHNPINIDISYWNRKRRSAPFSFISLGLENILTSPTESTFANNHHFIDSVRGNPPTECMRSSHCSRFETPKLPFFSEKFLRLSRT
ncbi:hypothetical protein IWX91DRAFT_333644 [Phyllosticta citricarpa]